MNEFEIPASCTSASFTLRNHYNKCLYQYERRYYTGGSNSHNAQYEREERATVTEPIAQGNAQ